MRTRSIATLLLLAGPLFAAPAAAQSLVVVGVQPAGFAEAAVASCAGGAMIGYSAFAYAVRTLPMTSVATYGYVNPIVAVILGATILHEPVTWNVLTGGAAVIVSVVLILVGSRPRGELPAAA